MKSISSISGLLLILLVCNCSPESQSYKSEQYLKLSAHLREGVTAVTGDMSNDLRAVLFSPSDYQYRECVKEISEFAELHARNKKIIWLYRTVAGNVGVNCSNGETLQLTFDKRVVWNNELLTDFPVIYYLKEGEIISRENLDPGSITEKLAKLEKKIAS